MNDLEERLRVQADLEPPNNGVMAIRAWMDTARYYLREAAAELARLRGKDDLIEMVEINGIKYATQQEVGHEIAHLRGSKDSSGPGGLDPYRLRAIEGDEHNIRAAKYWSAHPVESSGQQTPTGQAETPPPTPAVSAGPAQEPLGEAQCEDCGGHNPVWFTRNEIWNAAHGCRDILCPLCFIKRAEKAGLNKDAWLLAPEFYASQAESTATPRRLSDIMIDPAGLDSSAKISAEHDAYHETGMCYGDSHAACMQRIERVEQTAGPAQEPDRPSMWHTNECAVHSPTLRPCSCGLETRLRDYILQLEWRLAQWRTKHLADAEVGASPPQTETRPEGYENVPMGPIGAADFPLRASESAATQITTTDQAETPPTGPALAATPSGPGREPTETDVLQAIARGRCHKKNIHKEMDHDLAIAICDEVRALYRDAAPHAEERDVDRPSGIVRIALRVLLNHVEPGWDNSKTVVQHWLDDLTSDERCACRRKP